MQAIDIHVHHRTTQRASHGLGDAKRLFASDSVVAPDVYFPQRRIGAVVFDVDRETTTGEKIDNDVIAKMAAGSDGWLIGFASVDPWKGDDAIAEIERCAKLGLRGLKVHPITQKFDFGDERFFPIWETCERLGWPILLHTGTTGIGAGSPGGRGLMLEYGRPVPAIDRVAGTFADLRLIAAHFAWPWHLELLAVARHKGNVYIDLSGWSPKYFPDEVVKYMNSVIPDKFLFGSDYPLMTPERWKKDFDGLAIKDEVVQKVMLDNARQLLDWSQPSE